MSPRIIKKIILTITIILSFQACSEKSEIRYTKEEFHKKVDSLYNIQAQKINKEAEENLELRRRIEVRPMAEKINEDNRKSGIKKNDTIVNN